RVEWHALGIDEDFALRRFRGFQCVGRCSRSSENKSQSRHGGERSGYRELLIKSVLGRGCVVETNAGTAELFRAVAFVEDGIAPTNFLKSLVRRFVAARHGCVRNAACRAEF